MNLKLRCDDFRKPRFRRTKPPRALAARTLSLAWAFVVWLLTSTGHAQKVADIIYERGGTQAISGEIAGVSPDQITIRDGAETKTVDVADVTRMLLSDDPPGLRGVRGDALMGAWEEAQRKLAEVRVGPGSREIVRQDVAYYEALVKSRLAMQGKGDPADAARGLVGFLKDNSQSFRYYAACEALGDLAMLMERFDAAANSYSRLEQSRSPAVLALGSVLQGNAWLRQGDVDKAAQLFEQASTAKDDRVQAEALVGLAVCRAEQGQPQAGVQLLQEIIAQHDAEDFELFARVYNALGRCYQAAGKNEDALLAYLHTDLLYSREFDAHAEALFHLSQLWASVQKPAEAAKSRELLQQKYAATSWAKK